MANVTERLAASDYRKLVGAGHSSAARRSASSPRSRGAKYRNVKTTTAGGIFDSARESRTAADFELGRNAVEPWMRVVDVRRQVRFLVIPKQEGERAAFYVADFVATYADVHVEVVDTKSSFTRKLPTYVLKRKLMLSVHGVRIREA